MTPYVYRVVLDPGAMTLLAASGPHHLSTLLDEYHLADDVVCVECLGRLSNFRLDEGDARDSHAGCWRCD